VSDEPFLAWWVAQHEATHAVAAQKVGLTVAWVSIDPGCDEGLNFNAAVKIPDETLDFERDVLAIAIAMAAPSHMPKLQGGERMQALNRYADLEARLAYEMAGRFGYRYEEVYDECSRIVNEHEDEIHELRDRLMDEGRVVFQTA